MGSSETRNLKGDHERSMMSSSQVEVELDNGNSSEGLSSSNYRSGGLNYSSGGLNYSSGGLNYSSGGLNSSHGLNISNYNSGGLNSSGLDINKHLVEEVELDQAEEVQLPRGNLVADVMEMEPASKRRTTFSVFFWTRYPSN